MAARVATGANAQKLPPNKRGTPKPATPGGRDGRHRRGGMPGAGSHRKHWHGGQICHWIYPGCPPVRTERLTGRRTGDNQGARSAD